MNAKHHPLLRFMIVPLAVAVAMAVRFLLWPVIGGELPFLLLWPAVMFCAWYGGFGPDLTATLLSALAETFFVLEPRNSFAIDKEAEAVGVAMFVLLGVMISWLTERLHCANRTSHEANRQKDVFLATLAHELRNPLAALRNALAVLKMPGVNSSILERTAELIGRQVHLMTRFVDDLLDVARIERGKLQLQKELVDLSAVVAQAVETSRPLIEERCQSLSVTLPPGPVRRFADAARLAQVIGNLLTNAAKYTDEGGRITVTADVEAGEVVVRVRDTGVGIPAEMLPHVFDWFAQVDSSMGRAKGGMGIGLGLVQGLVEAHGGTVEAHSEGPGKGSQFVVRLPVPNKVP